MTDFRCPWCGHGMNGREDWFVYGGDYKETCPECGKAFTVEVNQTIEFDAQVPAALGDCWSECGSWDTDDFCAHETSENAAPAWCPQGFGK